MNIIQNTDNSFLKPRDAWDRLSHRAWHSVMGKWKEGVKTSSFTIDWLQKPVDEYEVDGLDVF